MKRKLFFVLLLALIVLHHDFWFWDDPALVFGFLPIGLAYHGLYSIAAAGLWALASRVVWPIGVDDFPPPVRRPRP